MKKVDDIIINSKIVAIALGEYKFQTELTKRLDSLSELTEINLLEIVLWKTNRYPAINEEILHQLNSLKQNCNRDNAAQVLRNLLSLRGFDLPMASTVLRFIRPDKFQIIDQRVYRLIMPEANELKLPYSDEAKIKMYFDYLDHLKRVCERNQINFQVSDRIFYQLDKKHNASIAIKY
jgi:thermostable 8-oxoguanine DNA glycosylase